MAMFKTRALAEGGGVSSGQDAPGELPGEQIWVPQCWIQERNQVFLKELPVFHVGKHIQAPL